MDNYLKQHWRGELPLWKSYWLNSVLLSNLALLLAAMLMGFLWGTIIGAFGLARPPQKFWDISSWFVAIPFVVWSIGGTWRAAEKYKTERGGVVNWGGVAQVAMCVGVFQFILTIVSFLTR